VHIAVLSILPDVFDAYLAHGIVRRAIDGGVLKTDIYNLRDFTADRHRTVDDTPYGGGPGMVMKPEPFETAIEHIKSDGIETLTIMPSPQGRPFDQAMAEELSKESRRLLFLCGRYEGIDDRVREVYADREISVGDYVLSGGELPSLVIIDAVVRLLPGAVGDEKSLSEESFSWGILDYPHYTRPPEWRGFKVPEVLVSGNHREIELWRRREALRRTLKRRPDLLERATLSEEDKKLLESIKEEEH
jgi:tRNA (guanine37-N1)-methyltransferase